MVETFDLAVKGLQGQKTPPSDRRAPHVMRIAVLMG
jgi:hypothetical protein